MLRLVDPVSRTLLAISHQLGLPTSDVLHVPDSNLCATGITSRAQAVQPGDLFLAFPGATTHGAKYAQVAIDNGAVAILTDRAGAAFVPTNVPTLIQENPRVRAGDLAAWFYGRPLQAMTSVGITGTNGKTTVTTLLYQLWHDAQIEAGLIGTIGTYIGSDFYASERTTPEADELQNTFAVMKERHIKNVAMEVSSHALAQHRIDGSMFSIAGFTHLTQDHLDFHGTMENYFNAKAKLFTLQFARKAFIMIDDEYGRELTKRSEIPFVTLSRTNSAATWHVVSAEPISRGWEIAIRGEGGILIEGTLPLLGEHNVDNALLAIALAVESGLDPLFVGNQLRTLRGAPGRLEKVELGQKFHALVDYAHTPDAVKRALASVRQFTSGRVIAVLGCGGDRDQSKRPLMGDALLMGADVAIFTSDNPRSENPDDIIQQMVGKHTISSPHQIISDRRAAIAHAIAQAQPNDCVIVLGKGHESGQEIAGVITPFSDRDVVAATIGGNS